MQFNQEILLPLMEESVREEFLTYKGIETNMLKYFSNVQRFVWLLIINNLIEKP